MEKSIPVLCSLLFMLACTGPKKEPSADKIIDKAIAMAGGEFFSRSTVRYSFRGNTYVSTRDGGSFRLERYITYPDGRKFHDVLRNEGFTRYHKGEAVPLSDSMRTLYANSLNSVHYFTFLPFGLKDQAANRTLIGKDSILGREYYEIKVTFDVEGGGEDHEDVYMYWINTNDFSIDYLAYSFEVNEGGMRFRQAYNPRRIGGIRFVDYKNYKPVKNEPRLETLDELFEAGELELLSKIENKNIKVDPLD